MKSHISWIALLHLRVRVQLIIRHLKTCTTDIYIHNDCAHVGLSIHAPVHTKVQEGLVKKADQILPYFAVNELPEGVAGILTAAVLGSTMSVYRYGSGSTYGLFAYNP